MAQHRNDLYQVAISVKHDSCVDYLYGEYKQNHLKHHYFDRFEQLKLIELLRLSHRDRYSVSYSNVDHRLK